MINIPFPNENILNNFFKIQKTEILKRIKAIKNKSYIKVKKKKYRVTKQIKSLLEEFEDESKLKTLLLAKPDELIKIIQKYESDKNLKKARYTKEALHKILYRIFVEYGYNNIDKLQFIDNINLGSCPYCNRNYVFTVSKKGSIKPEIDHLYPKSLYPYLACSYFNLIPSCSTCNGFGAKEAKDTFNSYPILNPYIVKDINFRFSIRPLKVDFIDNVKEEKYNFDDFEIEIYGNKANLDIFHLENLYKQHKDIVLEILIKKAYYPQSYIDELTSFAFNEDEIYRYLFANYKKEEDLHKRPLSKLIKDITQELGL
jgi:5-methylcytosine-specific restriction endonuclease McrA